MDLKRLKKKIIAELPSQQIGKITTPRFRKELLTIRAGYFYHASIGSIDRWLKAKQEMLRKKFPEAEFKLIDSSDCWNAWPKDSYYEAVFSVSVNEHPSTEE